MTLRTTLRLLTATLLSLTLSVTLVAPAQAHGRHKHSPDRIELPVGFLPEGITIGRTPVAYLGSRANGDIYAANLKTGKGRVISEGPGPGNPSVGLKVDRRGLLYVSGGTTGTARVVDVRTGDSQSYTLTTKASFINDVVLTQRAAWFTNSQQPELYRLSRGSRAVTTLTLSGGWVQQPGLNANGITQTPDGRALLVIQSPTGFLFRVDPATGDATRVDLDGATLINGDGLLLKGRTLYVVRNRDNQVAVVKLNRHGTAGRVVDPLTSDDFDVPTTVAAYQGSLYLPNARFGIASPETAAYWITRVDK